MNKTKLLYLFHLPLTIQKDHLISQRKRLKWTCEYYSSNVLIYEVLMNDFLILVRSHGQSCLDLLEAFKCQMPYPQISYPASLVNYLTQFHFSPGNKAVTWRIWQPFKSETCISAIVCLLLSEYEVVSTAKGPNGQEVSILTTNQTHTAVENLKPESKYVTQASCFGRDPCHGKSHCF